MTNAIDTTPATDLWVEDFGIADYETIWQRQKDLVALRLESAIGNGVLIGEHRPVITLGRGSHQENLLNPAIPVIPIERGGDVTYHGPGQLVAYPILYLPVGQRDLHQYLRRLEQCVIDTMSAFGVMGVRNPGLTGVWSETPQGLKKLCSIGVAAYRQINPCGLESSSMTNLSEHAEIPLSLSLVKEKLLLVLRNQLQKQA